MSKENIEIIEHIMQLKISEFIKNNKKMDKKELVKNIEKISQNIRYTKKIKLTAKKTSASKKADCHRSKHSGCGIS